VHARTAQCVTYEVAAGEAVREVHGHMLGPEEADLIESDDSDKVGLLHIPWFEFGSHVG
jgi:hypothetical protein